MRGFNTCKNKFIYIKYYIMIFINKQKRKYK